MKNNLRSTIAGVNQNKMVRAIALEVMGGRASVKIIGQAKPLYGLPISGGPISAGQEVYVDYTTGQPVVHSYREQSETSRVISRVKQRVVVPDSEVGDTNSLHTHTTGQITDLVLPESVEPESNYFITGYDEETGEFTTGSPIINTSEINHNELDGLQGGKRGAVYGATGGSEIIYEEGGHTYKAHIFTSSGVFYLPSTNNLEFLLVGSGGAGGGGVYDVCYSAAGGGGEVLEGQDEFEAGSYEVIVAPAPTSQTENGSASSFGGYEAAGGYGAYVQGHGGNSGDGHLGSARSGLTSGAGGGDSADASGVINGGNGTLSTFSGTATYYGGGGPGAGYNIWGTPGLGTGVANSGGGGQGGNETHSVTLGYSGIVIIRYIYEDEMQPEQYYHLTAEEYEFLQLLASTGGSEISTGGSGIEEAPIDGKQYARKNAAWSEITSSGSPSSGISDAPADDKIYGRQNEAWVEIETSGSPGGGIDTFIELTDAPSSYTGKSGYLVKVKADESGLEFIAPSAGDGDFVGPAGSVIDNIVTFADTSGKLGKDSGIAISGLAEKSNVLERDNTDVFTPDADYEPATKKYVDDHAGSGTSSTDVLKVQIFS